MSSQVIPELLIGLVVLALVIYRQLRPRPVRASQRILVILLVIGLVETVGFWQRQHPGSAAVIALAGSLVLAGVFGAVRAATVRVWIQDGQPWVQGNVLTAVLWLAAIAAHFGYDYLVARHKGIGQIGSATVLLYLVASLGAQALVVAWRARRLGPAGPARASPRPPRRGS